MRTVLALVLTALVASFIIYSTIGIWGSFWLGVAVGMAAGAYHAYKLWKLYGNTECGVLDEVAAYGYKLAVNYIGTGVLLIIPFAVLWYVHIPSLLVYTVWAYATAVSYVGTGYVAAGFLMLAFSFFSYMSLYGNCSGHEG